MLACQATLSLLCCTVHTVQPIQSHRLLPVCCQRTFDIPKCTWYCCSGPPMSTSWCSCTYWFWPIRCRAIIWIITVKLTGRENTLSLSLSMSAAYLCLLSWLWHYDHYPCPAALLKLQYNTTGLNDDVVVVKLKVTKFLSLLFVIIYFQFESTWFRTAEEC